MSYRILVIDDDDSHLAATSGILEAHGYEVSTHRGAFGATGRVLKESFDLVLLDVNMPALSGEGLVPLLRDRSPSTRILLYSSNDEATLRHMAGRLGVEGWVCKGDPDALRDAVALSAREARSGR
jgi:CheY-like chemotaxis protein